MELYFAPLACSMSARIALAEAGAAINLVEVDTHAGRTVTTGQNYRAINPLGYVPALRLDDGTVLTENSAILQYIASNIRRLSSRRRLQIASGERGSGNG
jgi:glutathione S-transferase